MYIVFLTNANVRHLERIRSYGLCSIDGCHICSSVNLLHMDFQEKKVVQSSGVQRGRRRSRTDRRKQRTQNVDPRFTLEDSEEEEEIDLGLHAAV